MVKVSPSFLCCDMRKMGEAVDLTNKYCDLFHMDIMDGVFVPNISFGFPIVEAVSADAQKPLDIHLMIIDPKRYFKRFAQLSRNGMISFHAEACEQSGDDPADLCEQIRELGCKAGIAVNPDYPIEKLFPVLPHCDFILIMSVFAGFGGQKFMEITYDRIIKLKAEIDRQGLDCEIEVDGGVGPANAEKLSECGATILVAGNSIFKSLDPVASIKAISKA